jgi:pimeloyl-ACP methyl ester carboxylesterase
MKPQGQQAVVKWWSVLGVEGYYVPMYWADKEGFAPKLARLLAKIDELAQNGDKVSLVGTSAGASAVLVAFAARIDKVSGVVCICGKINHPETIKPERFVENPAFRESLAELQKALPKLGPEARPRILSIHPLYDSVVPVADTKIPGAHEHVVPACGHAFTIATTLLFGAFGMIYFLKKQMTKSDQSGIPNV